MRRFEGMLHVGLPGGPTSPDMSQSGLTHCDSTQRHVLQWMHTGSPVFFSRNPHFSSWAQIPPASSKFICPGGTMQGNGDASVHADVFFKGLSLKVSGPPGLPTSRNNKCLLKIEKCWQRSRISPPSMCSDSEQTEIRYASNTCTERNPHLGMTMLRLRVWRFDQGQHWLSKICFLPYPCRVTRDYQEKKKRKKEMSFTRPKHCTTPGGAIHVVVYINVTPGHSARLQNWIQARKLQHLFFQRPLSLCSLHELRILKC